MSDLILLAEGFVTTSAYTGSVAVLIGDSFVRGGSLLGVETRACDFSVQNDRDFQQQVIQFLIDAGKLAPGRYELQPAENLDTPTNHFFDRLLCGQQDILEAFCLSNGAIPFDPKSMPPLVEQSRFRYIHRVTITASSERSARNGGLATLPDNSWCSDLEPEDLELQSCNENRYTLSLPITFSAAGEEEARDFIDEIFEGQVPRACIILQTLTAQESHEEYQHLVAD